MKFSAIFVHKKWILVCLSFLLLAAILGVLLLYLVYLPKRFTEYVAKYSAEYGVEEELAYAVIRAESNFRADAVSSAGARGLMQIMPSTAQFIVKCIGEDLQIDSPEDNIRMGIWYISYLQKQFGSQTEIIAAYNAGEGTVRRWLSNDQYSSDNKTLHEIPFPETKHYIWRVKKFYNYYKIFYQ